MSTQRLHPLIWLARRETRSSVRDGTPPFFVDVARASRACMASGTMIAGLLIRACMIVSSRVCGVLAPRTIEQVADRHCQHGPLTDDGPSRDAVRAESGWSDGQRGISN